VNARGRRRLRALVVERGVPRVVQVLQARPWTAVEVAVGPHEGLGFSKVCYPDDWDQEKGVEIAYQKAVSNAIRQMGEASEAMLLELLPADEPTDRYGLDSVKSD